MAVERDYSEQPLRVVLILALCLGAGWSLSQLSPKLSAESLVERVLDAHRTLYYNKVGAPGEALQYYVYGGDFSALAARVALDPGIVAFERTGLTRLATVKLDPDDGSVRQRIKSLAGIDSIIRIPDFCH